MAIKSEEYNSLVDGLKDLKGLAYVLAQNVRAILKDPVIADKISKTYLNSKSIVVHGNRDDTNRSHFKIDHEPDIEHIIASPLDVWETIPITHESYDESKGTEFVIVRKYDINSDSDYGILAEKYKRLERLTEPDLKEAGGFKLNTDLTVPEVISSDIWLYSLVEKNNPSGEDIKKASDLLKSLVDKANRNFVKEKGMSFWIFLNDNHVIRPLDINGAEYRYSVSDYHTFETEAKFLKEI